VISTSESSESERSSPLKILTFRNTNERSSTEVSAEVTEAISTTHPMQAIKKIFCITMPFPGNVIRAETKAWRDKTRLSKLQKTPKDFKGSSATEIALLRQ
jgi:hypothetical protein